MPRLEVVHTIIGSRRGGLRGRRWGLHRRHENHCRGGDVGLHLVSGLRHVHSGDVGFSLHKQWCGRVRVRVVPGLQNSRGGDGDPQMPRGGRRDHGEATFVVVTSSFA